MPQYIGEGISHRGLVQESFIYPYFLAAGIVAADVGKAVSVDTTAANTVKLAADGDVILGQLESVEIRTVEGVRVGSVATRGGFMFLRAAAAPAVTFGALVCGAGSGEVRAALVGDASVLKTHRALVSNVDVRNITVTI